MVDLITGLLVVLALVVSMSFGRLLGVRASSRVAWRLGYTEGWRDGRAGAFARRSRALARR